MKIEKLSDQTIIEGIQNPATREWYLHIIYHQLDWKGAAIGLVMKRGARFEEAEEAASEALFYLSKNLVRDDFRRTCKLKTYFLDIALKRWLKYIEKEDPLRYALNETYLTEETEFIDFPFISQERKDIFMTLFEKIGDRCTRILELYYFDGASPQEIAEDIQLRGGANAGKQESSRCRKRLLALLVEHPIWKDRLKL